MSESAMETLKQAIETYENSLSLANVRDLEKQLSEPVNKGPANAELADAERVKVELADAQRQSYLAIVEMCKYLNSWDGAANASFLEKIQNDLRNLQGRVRENAGPDPFAYLIAYALGFVLRGKGQHKAALEAFRKSAELNGTFFRADAQMAAQQIYLDDLPEAKRLIMIAIEKTGSNKPALANQKWTGGRIEFFLGHYEKAIDLLEESKNLEAGRWYVAAYLCSANSYLEKHDDAERFLEILGKDFQITSLKDVLDREKLNPTADSDVVKAGRRRLHGGLVKAGLPFHLKD